MFTVAATPVHCYISQKVLEREREREREGGGEIKKREREKDIAVKVSNFPDKQDINKLCNSGCSRNIRDDENVIPRKSKKYYTIYCIEIVQCNLIM